MYIARLSNELLSLAVSEFFSIAVSEGFSYRVHKKIDEFVFFESGEELVKLLTTRSALLIEIGKVVDVLAEDDNIYEAVRTYINNTGDAFSCVDVDSIRGFGREITHSLQKTVSAMGVRWGECRRRIKIALLAGLAIIYEVLYRRRRVKFYSREPHHRPCYRPGTMKPVLARVLVNIARVSSRRRDHLLDPFCGVGGIAIEACDMGLQVTCTDIDRKMINGAKINGVSYGCESLVEFIEADSLYNIFRGRFFNAIVTDPPYGIQTVPRSQNLSNLIERFIYNSYEILKEDGHMVFAIPIHLEDYVDRTLYTLNLGILEKHLNRVHGSLTRVVYVVKVN